MINILIVEDDPMVGKFNRIYVEKVEGFQVKAVVENINEAWEVLKQKNIDLILLDIYMEDTTGLEMLRDIRKNDSQVDVIIITAANDNKTVQEALRYGAVDYLIKPFDFERLQDSLSRYYTQQEMMQKEKSVSQKDLDPFLLNQPASSTHHKTTLPKGLTELTFARVANVILTFRHSFTAADAAEQSGLSQVSVRKYLHYLEEQEILTADVMYQTTGRPLHQYQLPPDKREILRSFETEQRD